MSSFDTFDFESNEDWKGVESRLYFSSTNQAENEGILLKRKRKWYKANIDPQYEWSEDVPKQQSSSSSNDSSTSDSYPSSNTNSTKSTYDNTNTNTSSSNTSSTSRSTNKSPYFIYVSYIQLALHVLIVLNVLTYVLPFLGMEQQGPSFFRVFILSAIVQGIYILRTFGRPRWSSDYARQLFLDEQSHFLFLAIVLLAASPSLMFLVPFLLRSLLFICGGLKQLLSNRAPSIYAVISRPVELMIEKYSEIYRMNAVIEVTSGIALILNLLTSSRNLMTLFGYWQYLRLRYMLSSDSKAAFGIVRRKIEQYLFMPVVPQIIKTGWMKLLGFLDSYTNEAELQRQAQSGGLASKCTIM